ncbi:alpha/beta fold hydrolase [Maritimibacter dapengensis]|uniref:Alpha/beta hydrolase n=1 Tax=Maritimibacter dapengensis TaxID=2836868 RepID=A0ABS6T5H6_9RHOB|nr:alpha/beta hydrolase [Maritimibacter dapengensis]MBV7380235.1 alpha/beta hydrolase [Maritimibacter dapengensis]
MHVFKLALFGIGAMIGALLLAGMILFATTIGEYEVQATVVDDPDLPSTEILGHALHMRETGEPDAPTIIVLHGGPGGDFRSLLPLADLGDQYRVVFYDQRGAGLSERVEAEALTLDGYLDELDAVIDHASPGRAVTLIGHSWGAMLASAYLGEHPDKVHRAVLIEPGFLNADEANDWMEESRTFMSGPGFLWDAVVTGFEAMHVDGDEDASNDYLMGEMVHGFANHPDNPYHCPGQAFDAPAWRFGALASRTAQNTPEAEFARLAKGAGFDGPVLFMAGSCDTWIGPELQAQHAESFANARLDVIKDAGHDVIHDQPDAAVAAIRAFLDE